MMKPLTILYVEDEPLEVELLKMSMERYCPELELMFEVAQTIEDAKALFSPGKYIAALIDWNLPDGKGTDVVSYIREVDNHLPIMLLSATLTDRHFEEASKHEIQGCMEKDYSGDYIAQIEQFISS